MLNSLRSLYAKLPVIRELRRSAAALEDIRWAHSHLVRETMADYEERLLQSPRYDDPRNLNRFEFQVFSQFGEDGMVAEIFRRLGTTNRKFLEIGIGDGLQNNTAYLLLLGWSGFWIDANGESVRQCRRRFRRMIEEGRLVVEESFVKAETVQALVDRLEVPMDVDLLSLDVDRNTYYVWEALRHLKPRVAVIEYNGAIPPEADWKVDYAPELVWNGTMYFGASLKALENLGRQLGYALVGCNLGGANAFFVREELISDRFEPPFTSEKHFQPFRPFLERRAGHRACLDDRF
ncbi:MAG TPA: hypothetical protein VF381_16575 [Thermoanaerobaculia bacterium]